MSAQDRFVNDSDESDGSNEDKDSDDESDDNDDMSAQDTFVRACGREGNISLVKTLLPTSDVNKVDSDGDTALGMAMFHNHTDIVKLLLNTDQILLGTVSDSDKSTGLHIACCENSVASIRLFLEHKACTPAIVTMQDIDGETAEMWADRYGYTECSSLIREYLARHTAQAAGPESDEYIVTESDDDDDDTEHQLIDDDSEPEDYRNRITGDRVKAGDGGSNVETGDYEQGPVIASRPTELSNPDEAAIFHPPLPPGYPRDLLPTLTQQAAMEDMEGVDDDATEPRPSYSQAMPDHMDLAITKTEPQPGPEEDVASIKKIIQVAQIEAEHKAKEDMEGVDDDATEPRPSYSQALSDPMDLAIPRTEPQPGPEEDREFVHKDDGVNTGVYGDTKHLTSFLRPVEAHPIQMNNPGEASTHPATIDPETGKDVSPITSDWMSIMNPHQAGSDAMEDAKKDNMNISDKDDMEEPPDEDCYPHDN